MTLSSEIVRAGTLREHLNTVPPATNRALPHTFFHRVDRLLTIIEALEEMKKGFMPSNAPLIQQWKVEIDKISNQLTVEDLHGQLSQSFYFVARLLLTTELQLKRVMNSNQRKKDEVTASLLSARRFIAKSIQQVGA